MFDGVDHGLYGEDPHGRNDLNDAHDYLAIQPSPQGDVMQDDSDELMQDG